MSDSAGGGNRVRADTKNDSYSNDIGGGRGAADNLGLTYSDEATSGAGGDRLHCGFISSANVDGIHCNV